MEANTPVFRTAGLSYAYKNGPMAVRSLDLSIVPGKITAVVGANGSGKSTLFSLLTGYLKPDDGSIYLKGQDIRAVGRRDFARQVSVVNQYNTVPADMTVRKLISMGRTPYSRMYHYGLTPEDMEAIETAMEVTDTAQFAGRAVSSLSGGQRQRVWLAMALAQSMDTLLLDEITTYLDIHYQLELLHLLKNLNETRGTTIVVVLHDINQAMQFCDEAVVMHQGGLLAAGPVVDTITEDVLERAFQVGVHITAVDALPFCICSLK